VGEVNLFLLDKNILKPASDILKSLGNKVEDKEMG